MAVFLPAFRSAQSARAGYWTLAAIILAAVVLRLAAAVILRQPLQSDGLAYFVMAEGLAEHGVWRDVHGQHAFYSAGYPLLLAPFFALLGSEIATAIFVNLLLASLGTWLVHALTLALSRRQDAALAGALLYAVWLPGIWNATMVAKENLSTPLLTALVLCSVRIARGQRPVVTALAAGLIWGGGLVTGGSSLLLCVGVAVALFFLWRTYGHPPAIRAGFCFAAGALIVLAPWLQATDRMIGRPVLTTNAAFNLYLGHNPASTGRFVSIADTPMGKDWERSRAELGEAELADRLRHEALEWIAANPVRTAELALLKLLYFWQPNIPDAADFAASKVISTIRILEVAQYLGIMLVALRALGCEAIARRDKWIVGVSILGFWVLRTAAYIILRYRDPAMPVLIALAAVPLAAWLPQRFGRERLAHVA